MRKLDATPASVCIYTHASIRPPRHTPSPSPHAPYPRWHTRARPTHASYTRVLALGSLHRCPNRLRAPPRFRFRARAWEVGGACAGGAREAVVWVGVEIEGWSRWGQRGTGGSEGEMHPNGLASPHSTTRDNGDGETQRPRRSTSAPTATPRQHSSLSRVSTPPYAISVRFHLPIHTLSAPHTRDSTCSRSTTALAHLSHALYPTLYAPRSASRAGWGRAGCGVRALVLYHIVLPVACAVADPLPRASRGLRTLCFISVRDVLRSREARERRADGLRSRFQIHHSRLDNLLYSTLLYSTISQARRMTRTASPLRTAGGCTLPSTPPGRLELALRAPNLLGGFDDAEMGE
ncbi:hypothetical protein K438DRAFT_817651 [Mycena galopus ATCC 62051]|nr:hypothetical protein K438DRAFT_817651 [Mycena galopus ATCC 62051]